MEGFLSEKECDWYHAPNNIVGVLVNPITGELSKSGDKKNKMFYFVKGTEPHENYTYDLDSVFKEDETEEHNEITDSEQAINNST